MQRKQINQMSVCVFNLHKKYIFISSRINMFEKLAQKSNSFYVRNLFSELFLNLLMRLESIEEIGEKRLPQ